jgi:hypothetical protein
MGQRGGLCRGFGSQSSARLTESWQTLDFPATILGFAGKPARRFAALLEEDPREAVIRNLLLKLSREHRAQSEGNT